MSSPDIVQLRGRGYNVVVLVFLFAFHAGAVAALFTFTWTSFAVAVGLYWVAGGLGIGMGYHRLLTHRGYTVPKALEYVLAVCGTLSLQGGPVAWVATHRIHHTYADRPGDPHSPRDGFWWSHVGWIYSGVSLERNASAMKRYAPDLSGDAFHVGLTRWFYVPSIVMGLVLLAVGGWSMLLWGVFFRIAFAWHVIWLVNSATHVWGSRRFATADDSRNNWWVALLSFGEGWHNNHHANPVAARHGVTWYEIDVNWWCIRALQLVGLAEHVRLASPSAPPIGDAG